MESNQIKGSSTKSDGKDMETVTTRTGEALKKTEARCVDKSAPLEISAGERLIPIEIPRIIYWEELGVEPLQLKKIKIGPLTETNQWSEKRAAADEKLQNSFQETETQNKVVDLTEFFLNRNEENADKERKLRGEKEENIADASSKHTSEKKTEKIQQEQQNEIQ